MYAAGAILWLPPKEDIPSQYLVAAHTLDEGCFNHPVLILSADAAHTEVVVLLMTSLRGRDLQERYSKKANIRSIHLPIHPSSAHPDNGIRLFLVGNQQLPKNSYVKIKPCHTIKAALLKPWKHEKFQLSAKSLRRLIKHIGFKSPWPTTIYVCKPTLSLQPIVHEQQTLSPRPIVNQQPTLIPYPYTTQQPTLNSPRLPIPRHAYDPTPNFGYNRTVPAISCVSNYQRPVGWTAPHDQSTYLHRSHEQTPLLQTVHRTVRPHTDADNSAVWDLLQLLTIIVILVLLAWYFDIFG